MVLTGWAVLERQRATRDAELARGLKQVVRDIEWRMCVEQMAPLHPIADAMRDVTEQLDKLAGLIQTLGPRAAGPGHFAMGRGLLATDQLEAAIESLESARQTGYESPRLLATLGLAYGQMYVRQRAAREIAPSIWRPSTVPVAWARSP